MPRYCVARRKIGEMDGGKVIALSPYEEGCYVCTVVQASTDRKGKAGAYVPEDLNVRLALIQALIPLGLEAVAELLQQEVLALIGPPYSRGQRPRGVHRWASQAGSIYLADQKLPVERPRVRNRCTHQEVPLQTYVQLQQPRAMDEGVLSRILHGLSCREYRTCAEAVPEAFGLSASTISRRYIRASARKLQALQERRLDAYELVVLVLDGKTFQDDTLVAALGVTVQGEKVLLGFVETSTENETTCAEFLQGLVARGLRDEGGLLIVMDGGKGLHAGARRVFGRQTPIQRCQWHKRENVVAYLPKAQQAVWRGKLQQAYAQPTYEDAKATLEELRRELRRINESAVRSLDEGWMKRSRCTGLASGLTYAKAWPRRTVWNPSSRSSNSGSAKSTDGRTVIKNSAGWRLRYWTLSRGCAAYAVTGASRRCRRCYKQSDVKQRRQLQA